MKAKKTLYTVTFMLVLALTVAAPVLADEAATAMWVDRIDMIRTGRSSVGSNRVAAMVHIRDANEDPVAGATVTAKWTLPDGGTVEVEKLTCAHGVAAAFAPAEEAGEYTVCVIAVAKQGWQYDPSLDRDSCPIIVLD